MNNLISLEGFEKTFNFIKLIEQGLVVTVLLAFLTVIIGFVLGIILAIMRLTDIRPLRFLAYTKDGKMRDNRFLLTLSKFNPVSMIATIYVEVIRSTPVLVQIMLIYHGIFGMIDLPSFTFFGFISVLAVLDFTLFLV